MSTSEGTADLVAGLVFLSLVVGYHAWLFTYTDKHPHATVNGIAQAARTAWITGVLKKPDNILAAQLLRNWVLTAQLLGTASISVMFGMLAFVVNSNPSVTSPDFIGFSGTFRGWKIAILLLVYLMSFLCFAQVARLFGHTLITYTATNYTLNPPKPVPVTSISAVEAVLPEYPLPDELGPVLLAHLLNSGAFYWTVGTRLFSFSFPILLWFFGPWYMLVSGLATVMALIVLDLAGVTAWFERWVQGEEVEVVEVADEEVEMGSMDGSGDAPGRGQGQGQGQGQLQDEQVALPQVNLPATRPGTAVAMGAVVAHVTSDPLVNEPSEIRLTVQPPPLSLQPSTSPNLPPTRRPSPRLPTTSNQVIPPPLPPTTSLPILRAGSQSSYSKSQESLYSDRDRDRRGSTESVVAPSPSASPRPTGPDGRAQVQSPRGMGKKRTSLGVLFDGDGYFAERVAPAQGAGRSVGGLNLNSGGMDGEQGEGGGGVHGGGTGAGAGTGTKQ